MRSCFAKLGIAGVAATLLMGLAARTLEAAGEAPIPLLTLKGSDNAVASRPDNAPRASNPAAIATEAATDVGKVEVVTARYPNGKVQIEREVGQDPAGNYINQGSYKMYSPEGEIIRSGEFINGKQMGKWTQKFSKDEGHLFSAGKDGDFHGPFTSEAHFQDGRLHGDWTISDSHGQKIAQWTFENGIRSGTWTWWHPSGQKRVEATYTNGALNGEMQEWDAQGKLASQTTYVDGKHLVKTVEWYTLGQKHFEGSFLRGQNMPEANYDWWNNRIVISAAAPVGHDQKHGLWIEWYRNGNKKAEGQYDHDVATGKFTWWYENGQQQAEGEYEAGRQNGPWITWHTNGLKESLGEFKAGTLVGKSLHWSADGKLLSPTQGNDPSGTAAAVQGSQGAGTGARPSYYNRVR